MFFHNAFSVLLSCFFSQLCLEFSSNRLPQSWIKARFMFLLPLAHSLLLHACMHAYSCCTPILFIITYLSRTAYIILQIFGMDKLSVFHGWWCSCRLGSQFVACLMHFTVFLLGLKSPQEISIYATYGVKLLSTLTSHHLSQNLLSWTVQP